MYSLKPMEIWRALTRQPLSFWLALLFMLFEYVRPQAIYRSIAVIPWSQLFILATPVAFLIEGGRLKAKNPINTWLAIFSIAVVLSWFLAVSPQASQEKMYIYVTWVMVYILIANIVNTEARFFLFFGFFLLASLKMSQHGARTWVLRGFSFSNWGATGAPGWFHNSGEFGVQMCVFFPLSLYFIGALKHYWPKWLRLVMLGIPLTAVMSLIATNSRGALVGAAAVGVWMLARTRHRVRAFVLLGTLAIGVWFAMPEEQKDRFRNMGEDSTSEARFLYWGRGIDAIKTHPVTGIGYENWASYHEANYGFVGLPHNIFIQAGAELGVFGFVGLIGLIGASFMANKRTRRIAAQLGPRGHFMEMTARGLDGAMIGFLASGFFVTVLFYPYLWFGIALTGALHTAAIAAARSGGPAQPLAGMPAPVQPRGTGWRTAASMVPARPALPRGSVTPGTR
jgi:O-antigen ligase